MHTKGTSDAVLPLTNKQKCVCNAVMGVLLLAAGLIFVFAGTGVINASVAQIAAPTVLFAFGLSILISAIIAKNALSMWLAGVLIACGVTSLLAAVTSLGYAVLFPIYIAAPGIGCVFAMLYAEAKFPQVKCIAFFGILSIIFSLASSGVCSWGITGGLLAAFGGIVVILFAVSGLLKKDKNNA